MPGAEGILEVDIHGMNTHQAKVCIDAKLKTTKAYRLRIVHGYHGGTQLQTMVRKTYRNNPKVLRIELGMNPGQTDLVLREL